MIMMSTIAKMMTMFTMMMIQVGPGDDYMLTLGGFNDALSTLGDSIIVSSSSTFSSWDVSGMKFTAK